MHRERDSDKSSSKVNRHGLSRYIKSSIRRQIRQECGFGCVCCGLAIYQYEHIDPEFKDAKEHDPAKMALLCGSCHQKVTGKKPIWSKQRIKAARANPTTFAKGFSKDSFDISDPFILHLGTNSLEKVNTIIETQEGEKWLWVEPPECPGAPYRLSGVFYDESGNLSLKIDRNEWICPSNVWDLEIEGRQIWIRKKLGKLILHLEAEPPHGLKIHSLKMIKGSVGVEIDKGLVKLTRGGFTLEMDSSGFEDVNTAVRI
jgi:hypothetical protein